MKKSRRSSSTNTGFNKVTAGFVCQRYQKDKSGKFICVQQEFIAGDDVQYENLKGDSIETPEHVYQPFNMVLLSGPQIIESIRQALNWLQMRDKFDAGIQALKTLLKHLG